jgi:copper chaperone CopZ
MKALRQVDGVTDVAADFETKRVDVDYAEDRTTLAALQSHLAEVGWEAELPA